jgi:hypothetical protein
MIIPNALLANCCYAATIDRRLNKISGFKTERTVLNRFETVCFKHVIKQQQYVYIYSIILMITIENNRAIIFRAHVTNFSSGAGPPGEQVRLCEAGG